MKATIFFHIPVILGLVYNTGCAGNNASSGNTGGDTTKLPPVETNKPNARYQPAFAGQTRIAGSKTATP